MNVTIRIDYSSTYQNTTQTGTFDLRKSMPVDIAYNWWRQIKKEVHDPKLIKVTVDNEFEITQYILKKEFDIPDDNLHF